MDERIEKWLYDISLAISEIDSFFSTGEKKFEFFQQNLLLKRAIERNVEIIGEATNRILARDEKIKITNARKIVNLRNFVIHSYDNILDEHIWAIVINDLPILKIEIENLLNKK
jgi:uncharacterized protein with HEPN domain